MATQPKILAENLVYLTSAPIFLSFLYCHEKHSLADMKSPLYFQSIADRIKGPAIITLCDKDQNYEQCSIKRTDGNIFLQTFHYGRALSVEGSDEVKQNNNKYDNPTKGQN